MRLAAIRRTVSAFLLSMAVALPPIATVALPSALTGQAGAPRTGPGRPQPQSGPFATPLTDANVDYSALGEWVDGSERPLLGQTSTTTTTPSLHSLLWTATTTSNAYRAFPYGISKQPGVRHLRIGFKSPLLVGSILVRGGGTLSVLRPGAPYPGNLADESQWIPAQRFTISQPASQPASQQASQQASQPTTASGEVGPDDYGLWVLPDSTQTRALRFTHMAGLTDPNYSGSLGGVYLLTSRLANLAPLANVRTSANLQAAPLLVDMHDAGWHAWDNGPAYDHIVDAKHPESIVLNWPEPVSLSGVAALWAGFDAADVSVFTGPANAAVENAPESSWRPIRQPWQLRSQYPTLLGVDWLDFGATVQTRAIRLRLTQVTDESHHAHLVGSTRNGQRVWLGQLMALSPLGTAQLKASMQALAAMQPAAPNPPIPVRFTLPAAAYVSLVIDDAQGNRVRNLISDTLFPAGSNTVWWDGSNDLLRDADAAAHGQYLIPTQFVAPGRYTVRGIAHQALGLHYEFSVYSPGNPPWETVDGTGGWLTNHTPPSSALFVPAEAAPGGKPLVYLGCWIGEGPAALAWVDLDGNRKGGRTWIGGNWTGAQALARDIGPRGNRDVFAYTAAVFKDDKSGSTGSGTTGVLRLNGLTAHGDKSVLNWAFDFGPQAASQAKADVIFNPVFQQALGGIAIYNNQLVASMKLLNQLLLVNAATGKITATASIASPRGVAFDPQGNLLVLSGKRLLRFAAPMTQQVSSNADFAKQLANPQATLTSDLQDPSGITVDRDGSVYVSDQGDSNQVKVFSANGKLLRTIGHAGPSKAGPYDALHMNHPRGLAIDSNHHLWVAEEDLQPKRVSIWTLDGALVKAFYGPAQYGGGGSIDPRDKSLFYYLGMQFKLDWTAGTNTLNSILYREDQDPFPMPRFAEPDSVVYADGHRYFENTYLEDPTNGLGVAVIYLDQGGVLHPVAALGRVSDWSLLEESRFQAVLPPNANPTSRQAKDQLLFSWSDTNNDGKVDPSELTVVKAVSGGMTVMPDLSLVDSFVDGKAMRYTPVRFTAAGVPIYDLRSGQVIAVGAQLPHSDGGGQSLYSAGSTVLTTAPAPFSQDGLGGVEGNGHRWSYPSLWPGLHPAHAAPRPEWPGELEGTTRLLGGFIHPAGSDAGALWAINGNFGEVYLFTEDGLYVTQMMQDVRVGKPWSVPQATRNMLVNDLTPHDENFFPSMTQTQDGNVYLVNGRNTAIVRVDGLNTVHRLPSTTLDIGKQDLDKAQTFLKQVELSRQTKQGSQSLKVSVRSGPAPSLDNVFASLSANKGAAQPATQWATIDQRITQVGWNQNPDVARAALTIQGDRLFVLYQTSDPNLLLNSGATANAPFKDGGALDLMIGTDPHANPKRTAPVAGDIRLLVYNVHGQTKATLYRAVVPGTANPVAFSSPSRTITLDRVEDVSNAVNLESKTGADSGSYIFSIPLATLGLHVAPGDRIKADVGILRGNGVQTVQRVYWNNKATGITSDVPSEAELTPNLWGDWIFEAAP